MGRRLPAKERILEAAARLFHQRGYKEVGINEIIETSGTAKASFYANFKSKELLGEAWLQHVHQASEEKRKGLFARSDDARSLLDGYFSDLADFLRDGGYRGCPYTNTGAVLTEDEACLLNLVVEHKMGMRGFFRRLAGEGGAALGDRLFLLYSGATTEAQNVKEVWPVEVARGLALELWDAAAGAQEA